MSGEGLLLMYLTELRGRAEPIRVVAADARSLPQLELDALVGRALAAGTPNGGGDSGTRES